MSHACGPSDSATWSISVSCCIVSLFFASRRASCLVSRLPGFTRFGMRDGGGAFRPFRLCWIRLVPGSCKSAGWVYQPSNCPKRNTRTTVTSSRKGVEVKPRTETITALSSNSAHLQPHDSKVWGECSTKSNRPDSPPAETQEAKEIKPVPCPVFCPEVAPAAKESELDHELLEDYKDGRTQIQETHTHTHAHEQTRANTRRSRR